MKRAVCVIAAALMFLFLVALVEMARAAQTNWPAFKLPDQAADKAGGVTVERFMIKAEKKGKDGKTAAREFPMMFDIADKARKHKEKKAKEKGETK